MKQITLDELDQKVFFPFLVVLINGEWSPTNTAIMKYKLYFSVGSKRSYVSFESTMHKYAWKVQNWSQTKEDFHV